MQKHKLYSSTHIHIYPTPPLRQDMTQVQIFRRSLTGLNSKFSFSYSSCLTKAEEPSLPYYLPIAGGRIIGFIPFPRVLVLYEMQSVSSRIWTRVAVSISYDDNHYTTGTPVQISRIPFSLLLLSCWACETDWVEGACGVMFMIAGNGPGDPSSSTGWGCLHFP